MARFHGIIGFINNQETSPGVHEAVVTEREYFGEVLRNTRRWETGDKINDDVNINNMFSVVADSYISTNLPSMRYVKWMGCSWKITNIEVNRPRLILTIGGVYNGITS